MVWLNAADAELIEVGDSYARPTAQGRAWLNGTDDGAGAATVVGGLITACVGGSPSVGVRPSVRVIGIVTCVLSGFPFSLVEPGTTLRALGHERFGALGDTMFFTGLDTSRVHRALSQAPPRPGIDVLVAEGALPSSRPNASRRGHPWDSPTSSLTWSPRSSAHQIAPST